MPRNPSNSTISQRRNASTPLDNNPRLPCVWRVQGCGYHGLSETQTKTENSQSKKISLIQSHLLSYLVLFNARLLVFTPLLMGLQLFRCPSRLWACFELSLHLEP